MTGSLPRPADHRNRIQGFLQAAHDLIFRRVHASTLIYNACWEDPRIDRTLLQLDQDSRVVMITSAGCNALDYLLDGPSAIHAVDMNFRQNALVELKRALITQGDFQELWAFFGQGAHEEYKAGYRLVRAQLTAPARAFWDRQISAFAPGGTRRSFYFRGGAGTAAWLVSGALFAPHAQSRLLARRMIDATSLEEQRAAYRQLEPLMWGPIASWLVRRSAVMTLLGVPRPQIQLIKDSYPGGLTRFVQDKLRHVMAELPATDNYFWRVYINGQYTPECCPNYLRPEFQAPLRQHLGRLHLHTNTISGFLREHPGTYSHFVLLDHQDWLAWHQPAALQEEWELILANSRPGTRILMRSAGLAVDFIPPFAQARLRFRPDLTDPLHPRDRVGTYGSTHLAEVL